MPHPFVVSSRRPENNYRIQSEADLAQDPQYKGLKTELLQTLKKLRKENEKTNKKEVNEFIQKRVNEIQSQRINNPSRFFARAQPDSVFTSQQLWTVDYQTIKDTEEGIEIITTTTSIPPTVRPSRRPYKTTKKGVARIF